MKRHLVSAVGAMLAVSTVLTLSAGRAEAQTGVATGLPGQNFLNDPFSFYYAIYLPNQQLQAMRPTPLDSVNDAMVTRQYYTQGSRRALYDPISPYAETYDPLRPYTNQQERLARPYRFQRRAVSSAGTGPALYFNRIAQYYPEMASRTGRNQNANTGGRRGTARGGSRAGGGGGMGMGGGMGGMGGMRGGMGGMGGGGGMGMPGMGMF
jgi:hypothetical protein